MRCGFRKQSNIKNVVNPFVLKEKVAQTVFHISVTIIVDLACEGLWKLLNVNLEKEEKRG